MSSQTTHAQKFEEAGVVAVAGAGAVVVVVVLDNAGLLKCISLIAAAREGNRRR
jgi:hypothetical protein